MNFYKRKFMGHSDRHKLLGSIEKAKPGFWARKNKVRVAAS